MQKISFILILLFIIPRLLLSQDSKTDYEYKVLNEVVDELIDSMHVFITYPEMPPLPPPPFNSDSVGSKLSERRENENYKKRVESYEKRLEKLKTNNKEFVLAIQDTFVIFKRRDFDWIKNQLIDDNFLSPIESLFMNEKKSLKIDLTRLRNKHELTLKYRSDLPQDIWKSDYDFIFTGLIQFSRIYFNENRTYGALYSSYHCGRLCAHGDIILIKKIDDNWKIIDLIFLWVS
jgi:hypothetical protein